MSYHSLMITINSNFPPCVATTYIVELHENSQVKKKIFTVNFFKKIKENVLWHFTFLWLLSKTRTKHSCLLKSLFYQKASNKKMIQELYINKHGCALPKAFFQLFSFCPGMLLLIKWLMPIREDCMLQDQNPQESTSLTFFPYQSHFCASL